MTILENLMQTIYGNKGSKYSKVPIDARPDPGIAKAEAASKLLETLLTGESTLIGGKVLDLRQGQILLQLMNGEKLNARTETTLPLSIGDTAEFIVAGKDGKVITLKLATPEAGEDVQTQKTVTKALEAAGITPSERSETVTRELMLHSQPINEANIKKFMALSAKNPDVPIRELVLMDIAKIPVTKENIQIYRDFGNSEPAAEFAAAVTELSESIDTLPEGPVKTAFEQELKSILNDMLSNEQVLDEAPSVSTNTAVPSSDAFIREETPVSENDASLSVTAGSFGEAVISQDATAEKNAAEAAQVQGNVLQKTPDKTSDKTSDKPSDKPSTNNIHSALHMPPKDFADPSKVRKLYERLETASERLKELEAKVAARNAENLKEGAVRDQAQTHTAKLSSTLRFMDSVNNIFPFVQLPIKLKEENARGDLYVYEKKRAFKDGDTVSALLHLSLDNLGDTDILIKLTGKNAVITISAASESSKEVFCSEIPGLTDALQKKGYSLNCDVNVAENKEEQAPLLTRFLEAHSPSLVSRFSFDMRA